MDQITRRTPEEITIEDAERLVGACAWPAEAFWRMIELREVRRITPLAGPVLELGSGDGVFTSLTGAWIDQAIDVRRNAVSRSRALTETYGEVAEMDMRDLGSAELGRFASIFSNSVMEHVPDLAPILAACREKLEPGGRLILTVPLVTMNQHLALKSARYARMRQGQLQHRNLWSQEQWIAALRAAGFAEVGAIGYLDARACRFWDTVDLLGSFGVGRYRVATALQRAVRIALPGRLRARFRALIARRLLARAAARAEGEHCAALLVAVAGA